MNRREIVWNFVGKAARAGLVLGAVSMLMGQSAGLAPKGTTDGAKPPVVRREMRQFLGLGAPPDAAAAARGEKLYAPNCAFCHGVRANGAEAPDLVRSSLVLHDEKGEAIAPLVHNGRPDRGMPPFPSFSDAELYDIAEFLHMRVELAANRGLYQVQNIVTGNARTGQAYFEGAGQCASCHSVTGDLAHIGSKMQPVDLQQAFLYPGARKSEPARVTVVLASGQSISGTLKRMDDFQVSLYDAAGEYHSYAITGGVRVDVEDKLLKHRQLLERYTDADMHNLTAYLVTLR